MAAELRRTTLVPIVLEPGLETFNLTLQKGSCTPAASGHALLSGAADPGVSAVFGDLVLDDSKFRMAVPESRLYDWG